MTIAEIAKLAGTSRGTVDRVINGRGKVNKELEERIKEIIRENDYEVNGSARALSMSQKSMRWVWSSTPSATPFSPV